MLEKSAASRHLSSLATPPADLLLRFYLINCFLVSLAALFLFVLSHFLPSAYTSFTSSFFCPFRHLSICATLSPPQLVLLGLAHILILTCV